MKTHPLVSALFAAVLLTANGAAMAEKPDWAGGDKAKQGKSEQRIDDRRDRGDRYDREDRRDRGDRYDRDDRRDRDDRYDRDDRRDRGDRDGRRDRRDSYRFDDDSRRVIFDYYGAQARMGHCPPGLAKKNNGCMPPGQAKKWRIGHPLPRDLRYYDLPGDILVRLPPPPPRHRYVQVAGDILMIAVGTSMVVDAVENILR